MATARKLPSGKWRVLQYIGMVDGARKYKSFTASSKKEAEYQAAEYMMEHKRYEAPTNITVEAAMDRYINSKTEVLSPETIRSYKKIKKNRLQGILHTQLSALTQEKIQVAINEDAKRLKPKTIQDTHGFLSAVLAEYHPDFKLRTKLPAKDKKEIKIPSKSDVEKLLAAAEGKMVGAMVLLGAVMGLRRSEMCALNWGDIDAEKKTVTINKAIVQNSDKEWVLKKPKSYSGYRTIKAPQFALDYLAGIPRTDDRVIPITPCAAANRFRRLAKKLDVDSGLHDLRHYNASVMLSLGVPDKYAMERMGHATTNMLKTVYQHTMSDKHDEVANQIDKYFDNMQHEMQHDN